jgi:hypothetical protein
MALVRTSRAPWGSWSDAISLVAGLFRAIKDAAARLAALGPSGPSLTAPAQLRWLAMNVAPQGDLRVKTSTSAAQSTRCATCKARSRYEDPAQDHNRALTLTTSMPGDPEKRGR